MALPEQAPASLRFTSPLSDSPKIDRVNQFLKDSPEFDFLLCFLEPCRSVDIPISRKFGLANYLRRTMETTCFDWFRRWAPRQMDLIIIDRPDHLDLPAWTKLLCECYRELPDEAFGFSDRSGYSWHFSDVDRIRHDAVHRQDFTSDNILAAVCLTLALKDSNRAKEIQRVVKALYETLSSGKSSDSAFMDIALNPSLRPGPSRFNMLYSIMDLLCQNLFRFMKVRSADRLVGQVVEQTEFPQLQAVFESSRWSWFPKHEADTLFWALRRLCSELRNRVEHRNVTDAKATRSIAEDAADVMQMLGEFKTAEEIMRIWKHSKSIISNIGPEECSSHPIYFLRMMKHLDCWRTPSVPVDLRSHSLVVRKKHPYLYCMRYFIETMERQAKREADNWSGLNEGYGSAFRRTEFGVSEAYELATRWYRKISIGAIDVDEARSPAVDYWDGKLENHSNEPLPAGWGPLQEVQLSPWKPDDETSEPVEELNFHAPKTSAEVNEEGRESNHGKPDTIAHGVEERGDSNDESPEMSKEDGVEDEEEV
ncbi:MAG: hypothetical protein Q9225_004894 [Loekoesia sp. 1 TL-2023]